jgi:hypothetical protein
MSEKITTDFELNKELKENGFKQDSLFYHTIWNGQEYKGHIFQFSELNKKYQENDGHTLISAPTAEELLEELPIKVKHDNEIYTLKITRSDPLFYVSYVDILDINIGFSCKEKLCNALAEMWLYLKKNNLLEK